MEETAELASVGSALNFLVNAALGFLRFLDVFF
jgi:hypothetical protein